MYLFKGKKLTIGNGLMEQPFGPGIIRQVITGEALNEIFDMSGRHEYHDVFQGPVLHKAKVANQEQRSRALVCLDLSIKLRNQSNDAGHARMCQTLVDCADAIRALNDEDAEDTPRDLLEETQLTGSQGPSEDSQWGTDAAPTDLEPESEVEQALADVPDSWDDSDDELDDADALELLKSAFVKQDVTGQ